VNDESERIWKEAVSVCFKVISEERIQVNRCLGQNSNLGLPEYKPLYHNVRWSCFYGHTV